MVSKVTKLDVGRSRRNPKKGRQFDVERPPMMYLTADIIEESGLSDAQIERNCGVTSATISKVRNLETKQPQARTLEFILTKGCGFQMAVFNPTTKTYRHVNYDTYGKKKG